MDKLCMLPAIFNKSMRLPSPQHTCGVHRALRDLLHILQELRLGGPRVAQQQQVDIAAQAVRAAGVLGLAAEEREGDAHLDVGVPVDAGRDALADALACGTAQGL